MDRHHRVYLEIEALHMIIQAAIGSTNILQLSEIKQVGFYQYLLIRQIDNMPST